MHSHSKLYQQISQVPVTFHTHTTGEVYHPSHHWQQFEAVENVENS